jgi:hypothetical protein
MVHAPTKPTCFLSSYAILIHFAKLPAVFPHPVASTLLPVSCKHLPPPTVNCLPLSSQHANGLDEILILGDLWRCSQAKKTSRHAAVLSVLMSSSETCQKEPASTFIQIHPI